VVIWATLLAAAPSWLAIAMGFENPVLAWIGYVWTCVFFALAWIALFWARVERFWPWPERYLGIVGGPVAVGVLLGGMEWLISNSLRSALWIGLPAFALALLGFIKWASTLTQNRKQAQRLTDENEQLEQLNKNLEAERNQLSELLQDVKRENRKLKEQRDELKAGHRRARIERWRSVIRDFDFHTENFASTDTYFDMEPELQPEVADMFVHPRRFHVGNEAHGDSAYRTALLREVSRIEREWGLI
jgi:hypothetical protein